MSFIKLNLHVYAMNFFLKPMETIKMSWDFDNFFD